MVDGFDLKCFRLKIFREHTAHLNIVIDHKHALHKVLSYGLDYSQREENDKDL